ncbi:hypothetical protein ACH4C6_18555 [Streptomyces sp. NPDC017943]|uniref:hypothetical protein n=1 Tax=Streptomyces sp. NPDC017943 TaxID=3365019 RepID=UPI0037A455B6
MAVAVLLGVLVLVVGGCVCVVWAERGGPRWVRVVAALTRGAGELLHSAGKSSRGGGSRSSGDDGDGD